MDNKLLKSFYENFSFRNNSPKSFYENFSFNDINDEEIKELRNFNKVIDVDWFSEEKINYQILGDEYFEKYPNKKIVLNNMIKHFSSDKDSMIYKKKTDYLCDIDERICICNKHADDFRKIYNGENYVKTRYIAKVKKN